MRKEKSMQGTLVSVVSSADEIMSGKYDSFITDLVMGVNAKYRKETQTNSTGLFKTDKRKTS